MSKNLDIDAILDDWNWDGGVVSETAACEV
jgi:hypothetical protein